MNKVISAAIAAAALAGVTSVAALALPETSDQTFTQDVLNSPVPVVVDFYANWCGPCRSMMPVVDSLASQYNGQVKFVRLNIDNSPQIANRLNVRSIPTFAVFKNGRLAGSFTGAVPAQELSADIQHALNRHMASSSAQQ